jgi:hypothetical protein
MHIVEGPRQLVLNTGVLRAVFVKQTSLGSQYTLVRKEEHQDGNGSRNASKRR